MPKRKNVIYLGAVGVTVLTLLGGVLTFTFVQHHKQEKLQQEVAVKIERGMEPYTQTEEYTTETIVLTQEDVQHLAQAVMPLITKEVADDTTGATREWTEEKLAALEEEIAVGVAQVLSGNLVMKDLDPASVRYGEKLQNAITRNITMIVEDTLMHYIPEGQEESVDYLLLKDAMEQNKLMLDQGRENSMKEIRRLKTEIEEVEKNLGQISEDNASLEDVGELTRKLTELSSQYTTLVNEYTVYKNVELAKEEKKDQEIQDITEEITKDLDRKAQESAKAIEENKEEIKKTGKQLEDVMQLMQESILVYQRATDEKLRNLGDDMDTAKNTLESLQASLSQTIATLENTNSVLDNANQVNARQDEHLTNLQQALETNYLNVEQLREAYYTREEANETFQTREEAAASTYSKAEIDAMMGSGFSSEGTYKTGDIILKDG
ncbi:MAG: hypothetical protein K6A92_06515, partial [Lachnospiraceae bacterium]|nr:hypothetical protein [Lachnospiraceae bacterium]